MVYWYFVYPRILQHILSIAPEQEIRIAIGIHRFEDNIWNRVLGVFLKELQMLLSYVARSGKCFFRSAWQDPDE